MNSGSMLRQIFTSMAKNVPRDKSNGYEDIAATFLSTRNPSIGAAIVREWSRPLPRGSAILDLGCGHGVPVSEVLTDSGFSVYGVDASAKMVAAFRERFPKAHAECSGVEDSKFFNRRFNGVVALGLLFLLPADLQAMVIAKVGRALRRGGKFLFTAPREQVTWEDALSGRESISLGLEAYQKILRAEGLDLVGEDADEGENHYYFALKP